MNLVDKYCDSVYQQFLYYELIANQMRLISKNEQHLISDNKKDVYDLDERLFIPKYRY